MKKIIIIFCLSALACNISKVPKLESAKDSLAPMCVINSGDIARLSANSDIYGMKEYAICMLRPGKQRMMRADEFNGIEKNHLRFMESLADSGIIVLLGFYTSGLDPNSFIIFNSKDTVQARQIMNRSPKVTENLLIPYFFTWYGPVALQQLKTIHKEVVKLKKG